MTLTSKQTKVLEFIREYITANGESPTYQEIQEHFGFKSLGSVVDYINYLKKAGFIKTNEAHSARNIELIEQSEPNVLVPILGKVAAGSPLALLNDRDYSENLSVPQSMVRRGEHYALQVEGESMIEDGIFDGDHIVVKKQKTANNGQTVVALVEGAATVKRFYKKSNKIELHPANALLQPIIIQDSEFEIQGILVALMRAY